MEMKRLSILFLFGLSLLVIMVLIATSIPETPNFNIRVNGWLEEEPNIIKCKDLGNYKLSELYFDSITVFIRIYPNGYESITTETPYHGKVFIDGVAPANRVPESTLSRLRRYCQ
jgi:hypothetical protein